MELLDKVYPTILYTVKCPMIRSQGYSTFRKSISGYQPQVGSDRVVWINIANRSLAMIKSKQIVVSFITT